MLRKLLLLTLKEIGLLIAGLVDFILPDLTLFSVLRRYIWMTHASVGKKTRIRRGLRLVGNGKLAIGGNCFVNQGNLFDVAGGVVIGRDCSIGFDNKFLTVTHVEKVSGFVPKTTIISSPIVVGNNVWITSNCIILPGTTIGDNVILAAGAVAKGNLESGWVYGGIPAKPLRTTKGIYAKRT